MTEAKNAEEYLRLQQQAVASNSQCGTSHYNLAVALIGIKKFDEAEKELLEAIECSPGLAEAYVQMGGLSLKKGELENCIDWNKRAIDARPGFSEGWSNIGFIHLQLGKINEAIKALEKATKFNFRFVQAFTTLANAYLMNGEIEKSIETNLQALKISPDFAVAHNNLAIAYLENSQLELAVRHAHKAKSLGYEVAPEIMKELER